MLNLVKFNCMGFMKRSRWRCFVCLCWGLTSQSTIFQSCRDGATASWVINQYFRGVKCLAQGHNTAAVGIEPPTSRSGVRHSTTEPPRSPRWRCNGMDIKSMDRQLTWGFLVFNKSTVFEKKLKQNKRWCNFITCLKESILWKGFLKKLNQILNFEIWTFYHYIDLYRTYFLDSLTFQDFYYTT